MSLQIRKGVFVCVCVRMCVFVVYVVLNRDEESISIQYCLDNMLVCLIYVCDLRSVKMRPQICCFCIVFRGVELSNRLKYVIYELQLIKKQPEFI